MYSEEDLNSAVDAGVLDAATAASLRSHAARRRGAPVADEEPFRLVTSFNDIFVTIASVLLLAALALIGGLRANWLGPWLMALAAWPLAEIFTRRRHMALPSILLLLAFVGGAAVGTDRLLSDPAPTWSFVAACAVGILAAWAHWRRFRVPITVAAGTAVLLLLVTTSISTVQPERKGWLAAFSFAAGLLVFWLALRWDMADRLRRTWRADVAFWLHLLAAPLLVNPVFIQLGTISTENLSWERTLAALLLYVALAVVSLAIDRRALMVSALAYVLFALSGVLRQQTPGHIGFAITALLLGGALVVLSARWQWCRAAVLAGLPPAWRSRLPPQG